MISGPEFFLKILCLTIYTDAEDCVNLSKLALEVYNDEVATNSLYNDELSMLYMKLVADIIYGEIEFNQKSEIKAFLMKFKNDKAMLLHPEILDDIQEVIEHRADVSTRRIDQLKKDIRNWVAATKGTNVLKKAFAQTQEAAVNIDPMKQDILLTDILNTARDLVSVYEERSMNTDSVIDIIDLSDKHSVTTGINVYNDRRVSKVYKSGLSGLNRILADIDGSAPGVTAGEFIGVAALSHHYKSGLLMDWCRWLATLNSPGNTNGAQPCILFISLENEAYANLMKWYNAAYANLSLGGDPSKLTTEEIVDYVTEVYSKRGFRVLVYRQLGDAFGLDEYVALHEKLKSEGLHISATILDYITLMKLPPGEGNEVKQLQRLSNSIANYGRHNGITTITGLQLSGFAEELAGSGQTNVVKKFTAFHLADCKGIFRELDICLYLHIETNHLGVKYLTIRKGKHRDKTMGDMAACYTAYRFTETGIMDDINSEKTGDVRNIYAEESVEDGTLVETSAF